MHFIRIGIDSLQLTYVVLVKINIRGDAGHDAQQVLQEVDTILESRGVVGTKFPRDKRPVTSHANVGFSLRFFLGPWSLNRQHGSDKPRRFGIQLPIPYSLAEMRCRGDARFPQVSSVVKCGALESDLMVMFESMEYADARDLAEELLVAEKKLGTFQVASVNFGIHAPERSRLLGLRDGISNLQDIKQDRPAQFKNYIFVQSGFEWSEYEGGTYLVYRRYSVAATKMLDPDFCVRERGAKTFVGHEALARIVGRSPLTDLVVDRKGTALLPEWDEAQASHAPPLTHIWKANPRGRASTSFKAPINVRDARILRRSFVDCDANCDGIPTGLLFLCYQADIQQHGFEFIHNNWIMSHMSGGVDTLLDPDAGFVEPLDGCYYFVPPAGLHSGAVFFDA